MKDLKRAKEQADKALLNSSLIMGFQSCFILFSAVLVSHYLPINETIRIIIFIVAFGQFFALIPWLLKLEQMAGYYVCPHCKQKHKASLKSITFAIHVGWTRYLKCPNCGKHGWHNKITKED